MQNQRIYYCIDMKSFFASVECAERGYNPFTTNLVVADATRGKGALCLAITPKMKSLGIKNRCRLFEIPENVNYEIAKPRMKKYIDYAADIYEIYLQYMDSADIHVYSIDECFIDATDYLRISFLIKLLQSIKTRKKEQGKTTLLDAVAPIVELAENFVGYSGAEKKEYVMTKVNQFAIENGIEFNSELVSQKIEELIELSKQVNKR